MALVAPLIVTGQLHASSIMDYFINAFASLTNCLIFAKLSKEGVSWKRVSCPLISMINAHAFTKRTRTPEITINVDAMGPGFLVVSALTGDAVQNFGVSKKLASSVSTLSMYNLVLHHAGIIWVSKLATMN